MTYDNQKAIRRALRLARGGYAAGGMGGVATQGGPDGAAGATPKGFSPGNGEAPPPQVMGSPDAAGAPPKGFTPGGGEGGPPPPYMQSQGFGPGVNNYQPPPQPVPLPTGPSADFYQNLLGGMQFAQPTYRAYQPGDFAPQQLRQTYRFDPAIDPSRIVNAELARLKAEKEAEQNQTQTPAASDYNYIDYGGGDSGAGDGGNANGGRIVNRRPFALGGQPTADDKAIWQALMVARRQVTAPNSMTIRGQDHILAYVTPREAELLAKRGGSGRITKYGIPAFDDGPGGGPGEGPGGDPSDNANSMSESATQDAVGGNQGQGAGPTGAGAGSGPPGDPNSNEDAGTETGPLSFEAPLGVFDAHRGMGVVGGLAGLGLGAPGLGTAASAIGAAMDAQKAQDQLDQMGITANISTPQAVAHAASLGMFGQSVANQFGNAIGFDAFAEAPMSATFGTPDVSAPTADTSGGPSVVPIIRRPQQNPMEDAEIAQQQALMASSNPMQRPLMLASGGAAGYADGGMPQRDLEADPTVQQAMDLTRQAQADQPFTAGTMQLAQTVTSPGRRRFEIAPARVAPATIADRPRDLPEEGSVTIKRLTDAFSKAISNHLALPPAEQIANARQAENNVAQYVGRGKTGKINSVLTANKKLMKAQTAGEDDSPLTLPDGRTLEMTGLALMPDYREGQFKMCGNSDVCRDLCLGKESGQYRYDPTVTQAQMPVTKEQLAEAGGKPRMAAFRRTMAMMRDPESFAVYLHELIDGAKIMAEKRGSHLGVRLNVLSDLSPKIMEPIIKAHPDVSFYDYTKMNYDPVADNHHYTYSSTGLSQPERGVENPFSNWRKMRDRLDQGHNVAMAFAHGKSDAFPEHLHDEETGKKYRVVSGDEHDFRPMDMVPEGEAGVIIALKNMAASNSEYKYENAARNSHGFFVHHEPDFERTPKGTFAVDQEGNRISRNKVYTVPVQPMKRGAMRPQEN